MSFNAWDEDDIDLSLNLSDNNASPVNTPVHSSKQPPQPPPRPFAQTLSSSTTHTSMTTATSPENIPVVYAQQQQEQFQNEIIFLKNALSEQQAASSYSHDLITQYEMSQKKVTALSQQEVVLNGEIMKLTMKNNETTTVVKKLEGEVDVLKKVLGEEKETVESMAEEMIGLTGEIGKMQDSENALQKKVDEAEKIVGELRAVIGNKEGEVMKLLGEINNLENKNDEKDVLLIELREREKERDGQQEQGQEENQQLNENLQQCEVDAANNECIISSLKDEMKRMKISQKGEITNLMQQQQHEQQVAIQSLNDKLKMKEGGIEHLMQQQQVVIDNLMQQQQQQQHEQQVAIESLNDKLKSKEEEIENLMLQQQQYGNSINNDNSDDDDNDSDNDESETIISLDEKLSSAENTIIEFQRWSEGAQAEVERLKMIISERDKQLEEQQQLQQETQLQTETCQGVQVKNLTVELGESERAREKLLNTLATERRTNAEYLMHLAKESRAFMEGGAP